MLRVGPLSLKPHTSFVAKASRSLLGAFCLQRFARHWGVISFFFAFARMLIPVFESSNQSLSTKTETTTAAGMIRMGPRSPDPMPVTAKVVEPQPDRV